MLVSVASVKKSRLKLERLIFVYVVALTNKKYLHGYIHNLANFDQSHSNTLTLRATIIIINLRCHDQFFQLLQHHVDVTLVHYDCLHLFARNLTEIEPISHNII